MSITVSVELQPLLQHFKLSIMREDWFFLESFQMEKLDLPGSPERQVTSAIVCQSQGREGAGRGSWEVQYKTIYTATSNARSLGHITETVFQLGRQLN